MVSMHWWMPQKNSREGGWQMMKSYNGVTTARCKSLATGLRPLHAWQRHTLQMHDSLGAIPAPLNCPADSAETYLEAMLPKQAHVSVYVQERHEMIAGGGCAP